MRTARTSGLGPAAADPHVTGQASAASSETESRSWASATGALVRLPACVFRPSASEWSSRHACCPALVRQRHGVGQRRVGQGVRRGVRHGAGHVGHAVEDRVVHLVRRVGVRGGVGVLEAAALVDRDVDQHRAGLHLGDQLVADQLGRLGAGDQHRPDHQVGLAHLLLDGQLGRRQPVHPVVVAPERHPQLVEVGVEQGHVGAHAERDVGGVLAGDAGADHHDLGVGHATDAAEQHAAAALGLHQRVGADLRARGSRPPRTSGRAAAASPTAAAPSRRRCR